MDVVDFGAGVTAPPKTLEEGGGKEEGEWGKETREEVEGERRESPKEVKVDENRKSKKKKEDKKKKEEKKEKEKKGLHTFYSILMCNVMKSY